MHLDLRGTGGFTMILVAVWAAIAVLLLWPGHLAIDVVEVDVLHALDGAMRMVAGDRPHLDFMTPLGALSFGGIALPMALGASAADAMIYANLVLGAMLIPPLIWLRATRLEQGQALVAGIMILIFGMSLIYGSASTPNTYGLFYNRWAWSIFIAVGLLILIPARNGRDPQRLDGIIIAISVMMLLLLKITYAVALALPVLVWAIGGQRWKGLASGLITALILIALVTIWAGDLDFWLNYLGNLATVSQSEIRPKPGTPFLTMVGGTTGAPMTLILMASIAVLRMTGAKQSGLLLLCITPGMLLISYQNWGNGPLWLLLVFLVLVVALNHTNVEARLFGRALRPVHVGLCVASVTLIAPYLLNAAASPFRNLSVGDGYEAPLSNVAGEDLLFPIRSGHRIRAERPTLQTDEPLTDPRAVAMDTEITFAGTVFGPCQLTDGAMNQLNQIAEALANVPATAGASILYTDLVNVVWMLSDASALPGGSPWYYGGRSGFGAADYLVVPKCAILALSRNTMLNELSEAGWQYDKVYEDAFAVIFQRIR